jgi:hypothetical protein
MILGESPITVTRESQSLPGLRLDITFQWTSGSAYGTEAKPRLTVVLDPGNSSLPHDIKQHERIEDFLHSVYLLAGVGETRRAIDQIFDYFNALLGARPPRLDVCNGTLAAVDLQSINSTLMVAFLSITLPVKDELWARPGFFAAVKRKLVDERGEDRAARLLDKYE